MIEILGENLETAIKELKIEAIKTYQGDEYQVWELREKEFEKLCAVPDDEWKEEYGMWRSSKGSNMDNPLSEFLVNGKSILAWDGNDRIEALEEVNGDEDNDEYVFNDRNYPKLLNYFSEEIGVSQPRNVCALAVHLAKINNITMTELFEKYQ